MSLVNLEQTLLSLKKERLLSGEIQTAIDPFRESILSLVFFAASTHRTLLGSEYKEGYTVVGRIDDWDVQISVIVCCGVVLLQNPCAFVMGGWGV